MKNKKISKDQISKKKTQSKKPHDPRLWLFLLLIIPVVLAFIFIHHYRNKQVLVAPNLETSVVLETDAFPDEISVSEAYAFYANGAIVLDVREPDEWREGHIPHATLIPLGNLESSYQSLPDSEPIIVVCRSGNRSAQARDILRSLGFTQVTSMAGGMKSWIAAGYDLATGD